MTPLALYARFSARLHDRLCLRFYDQINDRLYARLYDRLRKVQWL